MSEFPISQGDWLKQKATIVARIEELRDRLEQPEAPTQFIRGEIASLRWILDLAEPAVAEIPAAVKYT